MIDTETFETFTKRGKVFRVIWDIIGKVKDLTIRCDNEMFLREKFRGRVVPKMRKSSTVVSITAAMANEQRNTQRYLLFCNQEFIEGFLSRMRLLTKTRVKVGAEKRCGFGEFVEKV